MGGEGQARMGMRYSVLGGFVHTNLGAGGRAKKCDDTDRTYRSWWLPTSADLNDDGDPKRCCRALIT